jgi:hypothetical protein
MSFFILLLSLFTGLSYEQWNQQPVEDQFGEVIALNNSKTVIQSVISPEGKKLIPQGAVLGINDVYTLNYNYIVETDGSTDFSAYVDKVYFVKDNIQHFDEDNLLVFDYVIEQISDSHISLTLLVSLNMPETEAQYNLICNSGILFHLQLL